jgi:hypothetical protein
MPHYKIDSEEAFYNIYKDKVSYDYSGYVEAMDLNALENIKNNIGKEEEFIIYPLCELLCNIYIDSWRPTYESNLGKEWVSYYTLITEIFNEYKYTNYNLYDEEAEEMVNELLDIELDEQFELFFKDEPINPYYQKIKNSIGGSK